MESRKRKRNADYPRITYHASERTFDRLFKEESLAQMKEVARVKLGLPENTVIILEQIRDGKPIDLEDDDDFDAFNSVAHLSSFANVRVTIGTTQEEPSSAPPVPPSKPPKKKRKKVVESGETHLEPLAEDEAAAETGVKGPGVVETAAASASQAVDNENQQESRPPRKKKQKPRTEGASNDGEAAPTTEGIISRGTQPLPSTPAPEEPQTAGTSISAVKAPKSAPHGGKTGKKKRKREKEQAKETVVNEEPAESSSKLVAIPTAPIDGKERKKRRVSDVDGRSFPAKLAGVISQTADHNNATPAATEPEPPQEKEESKRARRQRLRAEKELAAQQSAAKTTAEPDSPQQKARPPFKEPESARKRARAKKATTTHNNPTTEEIQAVVSRVLAARRAALTPQAVDEVVGASSPSIAVDRPQSEPLEPNDASKKSDGESVTVTGSLPGIQTPAQESAAPSIASSPVPPIERGAPTTMSKPARKSPVDDGSSGSPSKDETHAPVLPMPSMPQDTSAFSTMDLDAIVRGPSISVIRAANIPLPDSSDDDDDDDDDDDNELELEEDDEEPVRRRVFKRQSVESSDEEDSDAENESRSDDDNDEVPNPPLNPLPKIVKESFSFKDSNQSEVSQQMDMSGDTAFKAALAADTAILNPVDAAPQPPERTEVIPDPISTHLSRPSQEEKPSAPSPVQAQATQVTDTQAANLAPIPDRDSQDEPTPTQVKKNTRGSEQNGPSDPSTPRPSQRKGATEQPNPAQTEGIVRGTRSSLRLRAITSLAPPVLPRVQGQPSRLIKTPKSVRPAMTLGVTPIPSLEPKSTAQWTTLVVSSPPLEGESMMVDELRSSPGSQLGDEARNLVNDSSNNEEASRKNPLFLPSESQTHFPHSQWQEAESQQKAGHQDEQDPISNGSDDEVGAAASIPQAPSSKRASAKFRPLSQIANGPHVFSTPANTRSKGMRASVNKSKHTDLYGRRGRQAESSESESDSDDAEAKAEVLSHIPPSRRAGAPRSKGARKR